MTLRLADVGLCPIISTGVSILTAQVRNVAWRNRNLIKANAHLVKSAYDGVAMNLSRWYESGEQLGLSVMDWWLALNCLIPTMYFHSHALKVSKASPIQL